MTPTNAALRLPERLIFGRGTAAVAVAETTRLGRRVLLVRGRSTAWADGFARALAAEGAEVSVLFGSGEPDLPGLLAAREAGQAFGPDVVVAAGGGSVLDLGKALAALLPAPGDPLVHFEIVGEGRPLGPDPLPFVAIPTTAGTGAEATKNAVIAMPEHRRKVSLRDDRMLADVALIDPALTDDCPAGVTLASGLDAVTQVIEPYLCSRATVLTDALCREAIPAGIAALVRLTSPGPALAAREAAAARDALARTSLFGGIALANAGLGAVHGLAGVLGGRTGAAHGALCGRLLPEVLEENRRALAAAGADTHRFDEVAGWIGDALGTPAHQAVAALRERIDALGLPRLGASGLAADTLADIAAEAQGSSSMKANPVPLGIPELVAIQERAL